MQQHLAAGGGHRVAGRRRYWITQPFAGRPGCRVDAAKLRDPAGSEIAARLEGTEIGDPYVILTVHRYPPRSIDAAASEFSQLRAVRPDCVDRAVTLGSNPGVSL